MSKKLVWFNPKLLINNIDSKLLWHRSWYQLFKKNICLVDGTGLSKKYGDGLGMEYMVDTVLEHKSASRNYENGRYWHHNFKELIKNISDKIFDALGPDTEIRLSYSGGTDSCTALAGLLSNPRIKPWLDSKKFVIYTTSYAKVEDPLIWKRIISMDIPIRFLDYDSLNTDESKFFMVTGDGDWFGTLWQTMFDITLNPHITFTNQEIFIDTYSSKKEKLEKWFLSLESTGLCWDFFQELMELNPYKVENIHQAWNWFEDCAAVQCFMYRPTAYGIGPVRVTPRKNWSWFVGDAAFSDLCMYESKNKFYTNDNILKYQCLRYIADWMGWSDIKFKNKFYSQFKIPKLNRKNLIYSDLSFTAEQLL